MSMILENAGALCVFYQKGNMRGPATLALFVKATEAWSAIKSIRLTLKNATPQ